MTELQKNSLKTISAVRSDRIFKQQRTLLINSPATNFGDDHYQIANS